LLFNRLRIKVVHNQISFKINEESLYNFKII
jgi:hypothetical protein